MHTYQTLPLLRVSMQNVCALVWIKKRWGEPGYWRLHSQWTTLVLFPDPTLKGNLGTLKRFLCLAHLWSCDLIQGNVKITWSCRIKNQRLYPCVWSRGWEWEYDLKWYPCFSGRFALHSYYVLFAVYHAILSGLGQPAVCSLSAINTGFFVRWGNSSVQ